MGAIGVELNEAFGHIEVAAVVCGVRWLAEIPGDLHRWRDRRFVQRAVPLPGWTALNRNTNRAAMLSWAFKVQSVLPQD